MSWLLAPLAVLLGAVLTTQVATNAQLGKALDDPYIPATVNMAVGLVVTIGLTVTGMSFHVGGDQRARA